jgi:phosphopantothenoylcysteine decarboxylase/phosphopantothenate--cysteine ligase
MSELAGKRILLIVSGGIAAYKSLELIRRLRERGASVRCVLTAGGARFVTPLSLGALSEDHVYQDLWSLTDEAAMGHIRLSREADLLLVAPASANMIAKMAAGLAEDLASTVLLATDKPVLIAPAMNVRMWDHAATRANIETLKRRGIACVGPAEGVMACGEYGPGRMAEVPDILAAIENVLGAPGPLHGLSALVTSGPTREAIDPVRYISNRSSGKQGHAIAAALARAGAQTTLVTGPTQEPDPPGVAVRRIETAREMLAACEAALPVEIAVCAAAVADWRPADAAPRKIKKRTSGEAPALALVENPDILKSLSQPGNRRPRLVIGFAAETNDLLAHAEAKLASKGCDWILANDIGTGTAVVGGEENAVTLITRAGAENWPRARKADVAVRLVQKITAHFAPENA